MLNRFVAQNFLSAPANASPWLLLVCLLAGLAGCEQVQSDFVFNEKTQELLPEAEVKVKNTLVSSFGSPAQPTIPAFFPVDRGQITLEIADFDPEKPTELLIEPVETDVDLVGKKLQFLFDPEDQFDVTMEAIEEELPDPIAELDGITIAAYDAESGKLTLSKALPDLELIEPGLELAANPNYKLHQGQFLYEQHCQHCHGVSGSGDGPTARYMEPKPRDYRKGIFKFTSTGSRDHVSTADLKHIIVEGIPGTYMPSFKLLSDESLDLIVNYVKFLAMRGETEGMLNVEVGLDFNKKVLADELEGVTDPKEIEEITTEFKEDMNEFLEVDYPEIAFFGQLDLADAWIEADNEDAIVYASVPQTDPYGPSAADPSLTSIENGRILYLGKDAQCASCHGDGGKGDGFQTRQLQKRREGGDFTVPGLHDDWYNPLKPRDLTSDIYRGGRRPIDIFRRIYVGIKGTPMPAFGGKSLTDQQIWDVVNYVMYLPHEDTMSIPKLPKAEASEGPEVSLAE